MKYLPRGSSPVRRCLLSAVLCVLAPLAAFPADVQDPVPPMKVDAAWYGETQDLPVLDALKRPVLEAQGRSFKDWTFTQGHATYRLSGQAAYFRTGGAVRGFYFKGEGQVSYTTKDKIEFAAAQYVLVRHGLNRTKPSGDALTVQEEVYDGLFWFAGTAIPEIPGSAATVSPEAFLKCLSAQIGYDQTTTLHDMALRLMKSTDKPYVQIQFTGRGQQWLHVVDELDSETFNVGFSRLLDWGFLRPWVLVSRQSIGWTHALPKMPRFALTHVDLDLSVISGTQASLRVTETLVPRVEGLTALDLLLHSRLKGVGADGDQKIQRIIVHSVKDAQGRAVPFDHSSEGLLVAPAGLKINTPVTLTFEIGGDLLPFHEYGNHWAGWILQGSWLPVPEDDAAQVYTVHARVSVPDTYTPIMAGETLRRKNENGLTVLETRVDHPIRNFTILAKNSSLQEDTRDGMVIRTFGPSQVTKDQDLLDRVWTILGYYKQFLGPFPFKELNILVGDDTVTDAPGIITVWRGARGYSVEMIARTIASQYWGQVLKSWSPEDRWFSEAFPQYCSALAMRAHPGGQRLYGQIMDEAFIRAEKVHDLATLPTAYRLVPKDDDAIGAKHQGDLLLSKGSCLLYQLHQEMGDEAFASFLQNYLSLASFQPATTSQIPVILKQITGKDYAPFFEQYYWGTALPTRKP